MADPSIQPDGPWTKYQSAPPVSGTDGPWTKYQQEPSLADKAIGMAKAAGTGLEEGAAAVAGLPGDIRGGVTWLMNKATGATPEQQAAMAKYDSPIAPPSSGQIMNAANSAGMVHQPQNAAERYTETAASFVPGAMLGPGSVAKRAASAVGGGIGSEAAGDATKGTALEPYARFGGAIVGGLAGAGRTALPKAPAATELKAGAQQLYDQAKNSGTSISGRQYASIISKVGHGAFQNGMDKDLTPAAYTSFQKIVDNSGTPKTIEDLDMARRKLAMAAGSPNPNERRLAKQMIGVFDSEVERVAPSQIADARKAWSQFKRADQMDQMERNAELRASQYSQSGKENALRTEFRQLARNDTKMRQYSPDEQALVRKVATGGPAANAARFVGKFSPRGVVSSIPALGGLFLGGPHVGAAVAGAGKLGEMAAKALTARNVENASEAIRRGPAGYASYQAARKQRLAETMARALLSAEGDRASRLTPSQP